MNKTFLIIGALLGGLGVILGAFGAHGLKQLVPAETVGTFQTGVQYQMYHAFALIILGILSQSFASSYLNYAGYAFILGTLLFSGSLYLLVTMKATGKVGLSGIGIITPFGGLFFILGWILLIIAIVKK